VGKKILSTSNLAHNDRFVCAPLSAFGKPLEEKKEIPRV
jgi:hypothetical protein